MTFVGLDGAVHVVQPSSDIKAAMKKAGLDRALLAGSGDVAACVRIAHGLRAGLVAWVVDRPKIEKGRALVLVGPQGCGKTRLAEELAEKPFVSIDANDLDDQFQHWNTTTRTVIVEGIPTNRSALERLKRCITSDSMRLNIFRKPPEEMRTPNFIFCTGKEAFPADMCDRRFHIVYLG